MGHFVSVYYGTILFIVAFSGLCVVPTTSQQSPVRNADVICSSRKGAELLIYEACKQDALCLKLFPDILEVERILEFDSSEWEVDMEMFVTPFDGILTIAYRIDLLLNISDTGDTVRFDDYPVQLGVTHPNIYEIVWNAFSPQLPRILVAPVGYPNHTRVIDCEVFGLSAPITSEEAVVQSMVTILTAINRYVTMVHHPDTCNDVNKKLIYLGDGNGLKCECIEGRNCGSREFVLVWFTGITLAIFLITFAMTFVIVISATQLSDFQLTAGINDGMTADNKSA